MLGSPYSTLFQKTVIIAIGFEEIIVILLLNDILRDEDQDESDGGVQDFL